LRTAPLWSHGFRLIYNKDLIAQPPSSFEELFKFNKSLKGKGVETIAWDYANAYFSYPLFSANGGYVFKRTDEGFDTSDVGIDSESFHTGAQYIKDLIGRGVMIKDTDYGVMDSKFNDGKVAMMINRPWSWGNLEKNGVNYGVVPLPTLYGGTAKPFVGVYSAMINANSKNKAAAIEFLENYLLTEEGLTALGLGAVLWLYAVFFLYQNGSILFALVWLGTLSSVCIVYCDSRLQTARFLLPSLMTVTRPCWMVPAPGRRFGISCCPCLVRCWRSSLSWHLSVLSVNSRWLRLC
jgi:hypothetical protein